MKLNLGCGNTRIKGFTGVDLKDTADVKCDVRKLSFVKDNRVEEIYASHILEHFSHKETEGILKEWYRVLKFGGKIYLAVPDLDRIIEIYSKVGFVTWIKEILYGGQKDKNDFHKTGFTYSELLFLMNKVGFKDIKKVDELGKTNDCSTMFMFDKIPVSLNVIALKNQNPCGANEGG